MKKLSITITGHRPQRLDNAFKIDHPINVKLAREMQLFIFDKAGFNKETQKFDFDKVTLISGMALGADTIWALVAIKMKKRFPDVFELESAIPCKGQESRWPDDDKVRYQRILKHADIITQVSHEEYAPWLMQKRNEYIVDQSDIVFAIWDSLEKGGTWNAIRYAKEKNKNIYKYFPLTDETWTKIYP